MPGYLDNVSNATWGWSDGEDGWGGPTNRTLRSIAYGGVHKSIINTVSTPPSNPLLGDSYIVGSNPQGAFNSFSVNSVAVWGRSLGNPTTIAWQQFIPRVGWLVYNQNEGKAIVYDGASWNELRNTAGSPVLTDGTSITGDGTTTALAAHFTQQQADFTNVNTSSPAYIKNVPAGLRNYTPPTPSDTLWQRMAVSGSGRSANSSFITLANFTYPQQVVDAYTMNLPAPRVNVELGVSASGIVSNAQQQSRAYIATYHSTRSLRLNRSPRNNTRTTGEIHLAEFVSSRNYPAFRAVLQVFSEAADNFNYRITLIAGMKFSPDTR